VRQRADALEGTSVPSNKARWTLPDSATLPVIVVPRRRGKYLTRRNYQQGYVYQKGRKQSDKWLPGEPAYVQFRQDIPGRPDLRHHTFALGICRTRTIAERTSAEMLEKLGINSTQHFIEATSNVTLKQQGEIWLKSLANRKRNPPEQTTIDNRRYALDKWIYPFFEGRLLADINNRAMKDFVEYISSLAPATIRDYANTVKAVVASALDENGEAMFPRKWSEEFIDAPVVKHQRQPAQTGKEWKRFSRKPMSSMPCSMRFLQDAAPCEPAKRFASRSTSISAKTAAHFTFARKRSAASCSLTQRQEAALKSIWMGSALVGMWIRAAEQ